MPAVGRSAFQKPRNPASWKKQKHCWNKYVKTFIKPESDRIKLRKLKDKASLLSPHSLGDIGNGGYLTVSFKISFNSVPPLMKLVSTEKNKMCKNVLGTCSCREKQNNPSLGLGVVATAGTSGLTTTATSSCGHNSGGGKGPFGFGFRLSAKCTSCHRFWTWTLCLSLANYDEHRSPATEQSSV